MSGGAHRAAAALAVWLLATAAAAARADTDAAWRLTVGPTVGVLLLDPHLADYRWDTGPTLQTGAEAVLSRGRFGVGTRVLLSSTTQASGIPGETQAPRVALTGFEILTQVRALSVRGVELWGTAQGGRLHMGYDPDQLTFSPGGLTEPVTVAYDPVSEWDFGFGLEIRGRLTRQVALALQADGSSFSLDTAHRRGSEIIESRERFTSWGLRLKACWQVDF